MSNGVEWPHDDYDENGKLGYTDSSFADEDDFIDEEMFMLDDDVVIEDTLINGPLGKNESGGLLNNEVQNIPGSPWAQPAARQGSDRATEPLALAKHASSIGFFAAVAWVIAQFVFAVW
jgi:hypothetical protein